MKTLLCFLACLGASLPALAQTAPAARDLVKEGTALYDQGQYDQAIAKYEQALAAEPGNIMAQAELALTYNTLNRHAEAKAVCEKLLKRHPDAGVLAYVSYGNSLDALGQFKEAEQAYQQGLTKFSDAADAFQLYYNLGILQATRKQYEQATTSFRQAAVRKPNYASAHLSLGVVQLMNQARIPAILALARFLLLEPRSARAAQQLPLLDKALTQGVSQTGEKSIRIATTVEDVKAASQNRGKPDDFGLTEMMLNLGVARTTSDKSGASPLVAFSEQFTWLCKSLAQHGASNQPGFTWNYYAPYFVEMEKKGYLPAFTYLVHSSQPEAQQWLAAHPAETQTFQEWSKAYTWPVMKL
ncbi:MAG: tetratricopeptide repeat protein [Janthinobacterium lividum]